MAGPIQLIGLPSVYPNAREITFNGATGANQINIPDNLADALLIQEGSNKYISFVTTNSSERIEFGKPLSFDGATIIDTSGNNLLQLDGGTAGVRVDNTLGIGIDPTVDRELNMGRSFTASGNTIGIQLGTTITLAVDAFYRGMHSAAGITTAATGTHPDIHQIHLPIVTVTDGGATAVTRLSALYVAGAPIHAGTTTDGPYSIFVDDGDSRFDGPILSNAGAQTVIAANGNLASANGADFNGAITNLTVVDGIVTAAS